MHEKCLAAKKTLPLHTRNLDDAEKDHPSDLQLLGKTSVGVAHDLNNFLTVVLGSLEALTVQPDDLAGQIRLERARWATKQAAALVAQSIAFARGQLVVLCITDLMSFIPELMPMLRFAISDRVELLYKECDGLWSVSVEPSKLASAILNLALNARDAMPKGGLLEITAENVAVTAISSMTNLEPGQYVALRLSDTGEGMSDEIKARVFEPFFTTKPPGKGTGLGLPMVKDLAKQLHGDITISSEQGRGTTVCLHLPRAITVEPAADLAAP